MRKLALCIILSGMIATLAASAVALTFDQVLIETWVGSGSSKAVLVVDFGPASFAFGYRFDGQKTGWDMISTIADQTDLNIEYQEWSLGHFIVTISYHNWSGVTNPNDWENTNWWEYWTSTDGETWASSWVGCDGRVLTDGAWDGWTWSPPWPQVGTQPDVPLIPEPSSLVAMCSMVGLVGVKLLRRK